MNRGELRASLKLRLSMTGVSTVFADATLNDFLWFSYLFAAGYKPWNKLNKLIKTLSISTDGTTVDYFYDYPIEFKTDSISRILVDGKRYHPKDFDDFLKHREENPSDTSKYFSSYGNQYFIFPTPTSTGLEILSWGQIQPPTWGSDSDTTIFSDSEDELNEAVLLGAMSRAQNSVGKSSEGEKTQLQAEGILNNGWLRMVKRRQIYQKLDNPLFDVPDYYAPANGSSARANFNYR